MASEVRITVEDLVNEGQGEVKEIGPNGYFLVTGRLREITHEQIYSNGTTVITIKSTRE